MPHTLPCAAAGAGSSSRTSWICLPALSGWRRELFGEDALALKHGRIALTAAGKQIRLVRLDEPATVDE